MKFPLCVLPLLVMLELNSKYYLILILVYHSCISDLFYLRDGGEGSVTGLIFVPVSAKPI